MAGLVLVQDLGATFECWVYEDVRWAEEDEVYLKEEQAQGQDQTHLVLVLLACQLQC